MAPVAGGICRGWVTVARTGIVISLVGWALLVVQWKIMGSGGAVSEKTMVELQPRSEQDMIRKDVMPTSTINSMQSTQQVHEVANIGTKLKDVNGDRDRKDVLTAACLDDQSQAKQGGEKFAMKLTHVINPFNTTDVHFNFTARSIAAAKRYADKKGIAVEVLGLTFQREAGLELPPEITLLPIIDDQRSAGTVLQQLGVALGVDEKPLQTPMVSDVFRAAYRNSRSPIFVWTNYDLIVREDFYEIIYEQSQKKAGFSALRQDLMIDREKHPNLSKWSVKDIFDFHESRPHAGHDCMVFPMRWVPCMQLDRFVFGVGGWGYAVFGELAFLSKLEKRGKDTGFSILKPGQHIPMTAITRHIGSQSANPARWYSNPVPWLGPLRRNQLAYNMRLKVEVEMKMATIRDPDQICLRVPLKTCLSESSDPGNLCQRKATGAQQPLGLAFLPPSKTEDMSAVVKALTGMQMGSMHDSTLETEADRGQRILLATHTKDMFVNPHPKDFLFATTQAPLVSTKAPRWPTPAWDAVVVLIDTDPAKTLIEWWTVDNDIANMSEVTQNDLGPYISYYNQFYSFWANQVVNGAILSIMIHPTGNGDPIVAGEEMLRLREIIMQVKLGFANRWCRGGTDTFNICCAVKTAFKKVLAPPRSAHTISDSLRKWIEGQVEETSAAVLKAWRASRSGLKIPNASSCCEALPTPLFHRQTRVSLIGLDVSGPRNSTIQSSIRGDKVEIQSRFDTSTRRERTRMALPSLFSELPRSFPPGFQSPCWTNSTMVHCVPHFFLLGQVKCGTTDLYASIARHPSVYGTVKEQHWFSREWYDGPKYIRQYSQPIQRIEATKQLLMGDGTPDYIWAHLRCLNREFKYPNDGTGVTVAEALAEMNPKSRLVLMMRNPIQRIWSDFFYFAHRRERDKPLPPENDLNASHFHNYVLYGLQKISECTSSRPLSECVWTARTMVYAAPTRILMGCYSPFIEEYLAQFDRAQFLALTLDDYHNDAKQVLMRVFNHIGARSPTEEEWKSILLRKGEINQQGTRYKKLVMQTETANLLREFYSPCNDRLARVLGDNRYLEWNKQ